MDDIGSRLVIVMAILFWIAVGLASWGITSVDVGARLAVSVLAGGLMGSSFIKSK